MARNILALPQLRNLRRAKSKLREHLVGLLAEFGRPRRHQRFCATYLFERRQVAGAVPNVFLKAREKAASEL